MIELTEKQVKTRWGDIKKQIRERPLLAYRVGIVLDKWDQYMHSTPSSGEVNRIYDAIQEDRVRKTLRLKEALSHIVGYREAKEYSRKSGVSDTIIREVVEGKKTKAGYDVINRLELFVSVINPEFELSIENPLTIKKHTYEFISDIASQIDKISDNLKYYCFKLSEMSRTMEKEKDWYGNDVEPTRTLNYSIERLTELKAQIDSYWQVYVDRK